MMYRRPITAESGNQLLTLDCTSTVFDDTVVYSLVNTRYLLDHLRLQLMRYLPDHLRLQIVYVITTYHRTYTTAGSTHTQSTLNTDDRTQKREKARTDVYNTR